MAFLSRKEFAEKCLLNPQTARSYISTNIKRGKIILSGKLIDDTINVNKEFIEECIQRAVDKEEELEDSAPNIVKPDNPKPEAPNISTPDSSRLKLDQKLKKQQLEKLTVDTRIQELKEQKLKGEVIPTEIALSVITQLSQSMINEFKNANDNILKVIAKEKDLSLDESARIKGNIVNIINQSADDAVNFCITSIESVVKEIASKRGVGERS